MRKPAVSEAPQVVIVMPETHQDYAKMLSTIQAKEKLTTDIYCTKHWAPFASWHAGLAISLVCDGAAE